MKVHRALNQLEQLREHVRCVGDVREEDWVDFFGESYEKYTAPIVAGIARIKRETGTYTRNDLLRPFFNEITKKADGSRDAQGIKDFYASQTLSRLLAYELGHRDWIKNALGGLIGGWEREPKQVAMTAALSFFDEPLRVLEHGFGNGVYLLGFFAQHPEGKYFAVDYKCKTREFVIAMLRKYLRMDVTPIWLTTDSIERYENFGPYHLVNSCEVMEHIPEPVAEVQRIASCIVPGGLLTMSTFFNSCNGQDPQHLECNDLFQDSQMWFDHVRAAGLIPYMNDPRGILKVWLKEGAL